MQKVLASSIVFSIITVSAAGAVVIEESGSLFLDGAGTYVGGSGDSVFNGRIDFTDRFADGWRLTGGSLRFTIKDDANDRARLAGEEFFGSLTSQSGAYRDYFEDSKGVVKFESKFSEQTFTGQRRKTFVEERELVALQFLSASGGIIESFRKSGPQNGSLEVVEPQDGPFTITKTTIDEDVFLSEPALRVGLSGDKEVTTNYVVTKDVSRLLKNNADFLFDTLFTPLMVNTFNNSNGILDFNVFARDFRNVTQSLQGNDILTQYKSDFFVDSIEFNFTGERLVAAVPVPAALPLLATGMIGLALLGRRKRFRE